MGNSATAATAAMAGHSHYRPAPPSGVARAVVLYPGLVWPERRQEMRSVGQMDGYRGGVSNRPPRRGRIIRRKEMPLWQERLFIWLAGRAEDATEYFRIPSDRVVEVGTQVMV